MLLSDAIPQFLSGHLATRECSPKTRAAYALDLAQMLAFVGESDLGDVSSARIEQWAASLRAADYAAASIQRKLATARLFFGYWIRRQVIKSSPLWHVQVNVGRRIALPKTLRSSDASRLLRAARSRWPSDVSQDPRAARDVVLVEVLLLTGIRVGESVQLDVSDVELEDGAVISIKGKGGRERLAHILDPTCLAHLRAYLQYRAQRPDDAVFLNSRGTRLTTQGVRLRLRKMACAAGIAGRVTPHMLRHTAATLLLRNGVDLRLVQEFLGHASVATTQRYTHISKEHLVRALRNAHPLSGLAL